MAQKRNAKSSLEGRLGHEEMCHVVVMCHTILYSF
jgi:hypothetical protein